MSHQGKRSHLKTWCRIQQQNSNHVSHPADRCRENKDRTFQGSDICFSARLWQQLVKQCKITRHFRHHKHSDRLYHILLIIDFSQIDQHGWLQNNESCTPPPPPPPPTLPLSPPSLPSPSPLPRRRRSPSSGFLWLDFILFGRCVSEGIRGAL